MSLHSTKAFIRRRRGSGTLSHFVQYCCVGCPFPARKSGMRCRRVIQSRRKRLPRKCRQKTSSSLRNTPAFGPVLKRGIDVLRGAVCEVWNREVCVRLVGVRGWRAPRTVYIMQGQRLKQRGGGAISCCSSRVLPESVHSCASSSV